MLVLGFLYLRASLVVQRLKHLPTVWETWVWSLSQQDPLEKEMATHSSVLAWRIPGLGEPGLPSMGSHRVGHDWVTSLSLWWGQPGLYVCVLTLCSVLWFLMAILLCLATIWFRPAAILLELDFLSLCLETRALRNTYLDHLQLLTLREKRKKTLKFYLTVFL